MSARHGVGVACVWVVLVGIESGVVSCCVVDESGGHRGVVVGVVSRSVVV